VLSGSSESSVGTNSCEAKRDHKKKDNNKQQTEQMSISPKTRDRIRKKMNRKHNQNKGIYIPLLPPVLRNDGKWITT
jgi:hypothetical protein